MPLTTTATYVWQNGDTVRWDRLAATATPTVPDNQSYAFAAGTVSAPSVTFNGDPNTGLYRPGADQVAITCGGTTAALFTASGVQLTAGNVTGMTLIAAAAGGVVKLGNAAQAGTITPTHTLTLQDSNGVTWKVPVVAA